MSCNGIPEEQSGQFSGGQRLFGSVAIASKGTAFIDANSKAAVPNIRSAPIATTVAPQASKSPNVPRMADPALITSLTMAPVCPSVPAEAYRVHDIQPGKVRPSRLEQSARYMQRLYSSLRRPSGQ